MRRWLVCFHPETALAIGGYSPAVFTDKATARDEKGLPTIPGTAVKGALRLELLRLWPNPNEVLALFGKPGEEGRVRFGPARWKAEPKLAEAVSTTGTAPLYQPRTGVAIDRHTRTASTGLLFSTETTAQFASGFWFEAEVTELGQLDNNLANLFEQMLDSLGRCGLAIGSSRSRGLGWCRLERRSAEAVATAQADLTDGLTEWLIVLTPIEEHRASRINPRSYLQETLDYIPGSVLRGAIATALGPKHSHFGTLFGADSEAVFGPLYPSDGQISVEPLPLSARSCKVYPGAGVLWGPQRRLGFRSHGVSDILLHRLQNYGPDPVCPHCQHELAGISGFYWWQGNRPVLVSTDFHLATKLAIDPSRGAAGIGQMYSCESCRVPNDGGRIYVGRLLGVDKNAAQEIARLGEVYLGGAHTRGYGRMRITLKPAPPLSTVSDRLSELNKEVRNNDRCWFTLDALADIVLPFGQSLCDLLKNKLGERVEFGPAFVRTTLVSGYNVAIGMPKDLATAILMGSCLAASVPANEQKGLEDALTKLEQNGIGLRRAEGFGRIRVCSRFHLLTEPA